MKLVKLVLVFSVLLCSATQSSSSVIPTEKVVVILGLRTSVNPITEEVKEHRYSCSGSFISNDGILLTAKHCTERSSELVVVLSNGQRYTATVLNTSPTHDLATIRIDKQDTPHFTIAKHSAQGETIYTLGAPFGIERVLTRGIIAKLDGDVTFYDLTICPGSSGGAIYNEKDELVGVSTAVTIVGMGITGLSLGPSLDAIIIFLKTQPTE